LPRNPIRLRAKGLEDSLAQKKASLASQRVILGAWESQKEGSRINAKKRKVRKGFAFAVTPKGYAATNLAGSAPNIIGC
jgi:hypothetical protein